MQGHLEITTRIGCRLACTFCPQKTLNIAYEDKKHVLMSLSDFEKIIETVPTSIDIHFSGFAEPFLNKEAPFMLKYAVEKGHKVHVYSTLIGLMPEGAEILKNYKPALFRIHVADQKAMKVQDDKWIEAHELFLTTGIVGSYMAMGDVTDQIDKYLRSKHISYEIPTMLSRGGNLDIGVHYLEGNIACGMNRWHQNVVLPNGDVYICCMDYGLTMPSGNLLKDPYNSIWDKAEKYKNNINPPKDSICRRCEWAVRI